MREPLASGSGGRVVEGAASKPLLPPGVQSEARRKEVPEREREELAKASQVAAREDKGVEARRVGADEPAPAALKPSATGGALASSTIEDLNAFVADPQPLLDDPLSTPKPTEPNPTLQSPVFPSPLPTPAPIVETSVIEINIPGPVADVHIRLLMKTPLQKVYLAFGVKTEQDNTSFRLFWNETELLRDDTFFILYGRCPSLDWDLSKPLPIEVRPVSSATNLEVEEDAAPPDVEDPRAEKNGSPSKDTLEEKKGEEGGEATEPVARDEADSDPAKEVRSTSKGKGREDANDSAVQHDSTSGVSLSSATDDPAISLDGSRPSCDDLPVAYKLLTPQPIPNPTAKPSTPRCPKPPSKPTKSPSKPTPKTPSSVIAATPSKPDPTTLVDLLLFGPSYPDCQIRARFNTPFITIRLAFAARCGVEPNGFLLAFEGLELVDGDSFAEIYDLYADGLDLAEFQRIDVRNAGEEKGVEAALQVANSLDGCHWINPVTPLGLVVTGAQGQDSFVVQTTLHVRFSQIVGTWAEKMRVQPGGFKLMWKGVELEPNESFLKMWMREPTRDFKIDGYVHVSIERRDE